MTRDEAGVGVDRSPQVALVVVNYGSHRLLSRYLSWTFAGRDYDGPDVVVVDNRRSDADHAAITDLARTAGWLLIDNERNIGFGAGVNCGAQAAWDRGADVIVVMNPDVELRRADVDELAAAVRADPETLVAPKIVDREGRLWGRLGRIDMRQARLTLTEAGDGPLWVSGACFCVARKLWDAVGGMDPDYFMYWEDVDLSMRVQAHGAGLRVLQDVVVVHDIGGTQDGARQKSSLYYYYNVRNRLLFAGKRLPRREMLWWLARTPADIRSVVSRGAFAGRVARWRVALPPALHGCVAGVWWLVTHAGSMPRDEK